MARKPTIIIIINGGLLYLGAIILSLAVGWWIYREPALRIELPIMSSVSGRKVVIDAGHGGIDPGAKSESGLLEKEINLDIALKLKRHLSMAGIYCVMIRETDCDFSDSGAELPTKKKRDLSYRIRTANQSGADIYLGIHANSFPQRIYRGAQTFYTEDDPQSRRLAKAIQAQLAARLGPNRRRPRPGDYRMLNDTQMPGVVIEVGFLSNPEEARSLEDDDYREQVAQAIFHGVVDYFRKSRPGLRERLKG